MIDRVLELIVNRGIMDKRDIAREVGIQVETLDDIIVLLCQRGYLRIIEKKCEENPSCSGCSLSESCGLTGKLGRAIFVTDKGKQLVGSRGGRRE